MHSEVRERVLLRINGKGVHVESYKNMHEDMLLEHLVTKCSKGQPKLYGEMDVPEINLPNSQQLVDLKVHGIHYSSYLD